MKKYRDNGAVGAILDEYEKALDELQMSVKNITDLELTTIADPETQDPDCKSIQTILTHVIKAGYGYAIAIRKSLGAHIDYVENVVFDTVVDYQIALQSMFNFNIRLFDDFPNMKLEEHDPQKKILVRWGQRYDVEQLYEHAIVHILRHRRQIERFLQKIRQ